MPDEPPQDPAPVASQADRFPIVAIGSSAGGLEALEGLVRRLARDNMAFVVVQHSTPGHEAVLVDILARFTSLRVVAAQSGQTVEPNSIYVAPPGTELAIEQGKLRLVDAAPRPAFRHSIDYFFRSLAAERGTLAIGVILSGSNSDGTLGLQAIKEEGGITFAQEPATALYRHMPQSAVDSGFTDLCMSPAAIGDELMRLSAHPYVATVRAHALAHEAMTRIFGLLHKAFRVDFSTYKLGTIERRTERRMALKKVEKLEDYLGLLQTDAEELALLYRDFLIGVTSFFRDQAPFVALKEVVFPRLFEGRGAEIPFRVWVAGCATGEEAYSIAISLLEYLGERASRYQIKIFATDMDEEALLRARQGIYPQNIELDVSADRLQRFFARHEKGYQVARHVRELVVFAQHDMSKDPPFPKLDLVSCRNVLIYMQPSLQRRLLKIFHYALVPDAFLLLGNAESVGDSELFSVVDQRLKIYLKKNVPAILPIDMFGPPALAGEGGGARPGPPSVSAQQLADRLMLEKFGPPGVLIDENLEILHFRGRTVPFLEPPMGGATWNVLKLARPELLVAIRTATRKVLDEGLPVKSKPILLKDDHGARKVVIEVYPLHVTGGSKQLLVVFNEATTEAPESTAPTGPPEPVDLRVAELERELATTKEYLQATIEQLETTNMEVKSSNEELQAANEEFQSTNEELATSKEELSSTNEELTTVNEELQHRMEQLGVSNEHLQSILANTPSALVIVGKDLRIQRYSRAAEKLFSLIPVDVGRPIAFLKTFFPFPELERVVADAIENLKPCEQELRSVDGAWYLMKGAPYKGSDPTLSGAVLEFTTTSPEPEGRDAEASQELGPVQRPVPDGQSPARMGW